MVYDTEIVDGMSGSEIFEHYKDIPMEEFPTGVIPIPAAVGGILYKAESCTFRVAAEDGTQGDVGIMIQEYTLADGRYLHRFVSSTQSPQDSFAEISETPLDSFGVISMVCVAIRETEKNAKIQITGGNRVNEFEEYIDEFPVDVEWEINLEQVA